MSKSVTVYLIADANILIDLVQAGAVEMIRMLTTNDIADIVMPRCVFDEISSEITETEILELGITLIPISVEMIAKVHAVPNKRLSSQDKTILLIAEERSYSVWTNDLALEKECLSRKIQVYREFAILIKLTEYGLITTETLFDLAVKIEQINPQLEGKLYNIPKDRFLQ